MKTRSEIGTAPAVFAALLGMLAVVALLIASGAGAWAQSPSKAKPLPVQRPDSPNANQTINSFPLTITVEDNTRMNIRYRNPGEYQFFGQDAEGVYLWVNVGGTTTVYGPGQVPAGRPTNQYTAVSNTLSGAGTPSNPYVITTVNSVPNTPLRLTQRATYVNGAEFVALQFSLSQVGGTQPLTATLFHAADLYTAGSDSGFGYYDPSTGGVGDYFTRTNGTVLYQQFVPTTPANAYMESYYGTIWDRIGDTTGPGAGFDNTIISDTLHDSGAGLQWNLTVPTTGNVTVGDTDLFSPHRSLCGAFSDVQQGDFGYDYIYYLACRGIVSGYNDTTFRPNNNVTRGQLSKIVSNSAGFTETAGSQIYQDVPPSSPFFPYVNRLSRRGFMGGYACGGTSEPCLPPGNLPYFRPGNNATRGQISKIVSNTAGYSNDPGAQIFQDVPPASTFYAYVNRLASRGVMSGYPCGGPGEPCGSGNMPYFRVNNNATRAQTAKIDANTFFPGCCGPSR
ncbi:MAG: S-layer homology domain-containing protein [Chloroflexi bacterium]|nr:S-layer homology domain-containing protein [Chloroflexota bacterium]